MFVAGLIFLGVSLSHRGWCRDNTGAPTPIEKHGQAVAVVIPPQPLHLAAHQAPPGNPTRMEGSAATGSICNSQRFRWLTGGFLGSTLCYYAYGYPLSQVWQEGLWPTGLLDLLGLTALVYLVYRLYQRLKGGEQAAPAEARPSFMRPDSGNPPTLAVREEARPGLAAIQEADPDFSIEAFGEEVSRLLLEVYAAWNQEHINGLNGRVKESLLEYLQMGLKIMSLREERSYLEDMILEGVTVAQARVEDGREFITVCFRGRLLDYVLDKVSDKLLLGSLAYPATFQEYWDLERPRGPGPWVLQDIRDG
jgi:hypothetical protein